MSEVALILIPEGGKEVALMKRPARRESRAALLPASPPALLPASTKLFQCLANLFNKLFTFSLAIAKTLLHLDALICLMAGPMGWRVGDRSAVGRRLLGCHPKKALEVKPHGTACAARLRSLLRRIAVCQRDMRHTFRITTSSGLS